MAYPTPEQALESYQSTYQAIHILQDKLALATEINTLLWHVQRCDAGVREPAEPEPGPALDFGPPSFSKLSRGDRLRVDGRTYTVGTVDLAAGVVELTTKGSKGLITLMAHGREPGAFVLAGARSNKVVHTYTKL